MRRLRWPALKLLAWIGFLLSIAAKTRAKDHAGSNLRHTRLLAELFPDDDDDDDDELVEQPLLIRFKSDEFRWRLKEATKGMPVDIDKEEILARHINVIAARFTRNQTLALMDDPDIDYIEYDAPVRLQGEVNPYGLRLIQALPKQNTIPPVPNPLNCSDENAFKVAVLDSGVDATHPDIDCLAKQSCIGRTFGLNSSLSWYDPLDDHGTMVAGIIAATRKNGIGITGVVENVCLIVGRIFASEQDEGRLSDALASVAWAAEQGARVINLSLGGDYTSQVGSELYESLYESGKVIVVASAGNKGTSQPMFPASYSTVISVAAVTPELTRAIFSQYNPYIDLTAPGVGILSTAHSTWNSTSIYTVEMPEYDAKAAFAAVLMGYSPVPQDVQGTLVECSNFGLSACEGEGGHVCLVKRGKNLYYEKALSCQESGGLAALIYDTDPGPPLNSSLGSFATDAVTIPVLGISKADGQSLIDQYLGQTLTIAEAPGYLFADGTSFSAPYVAGAVAAVWQACPVCPGRKVRQCFSDTALDLGSEGRDYDFGFGLIQIEAAYQCLLGERCCDADATLPPTGAPTIASTMTSGPTSFPVATTTSDSIDGGAPAIMPVMNAAPSDGLPESLPSHAFSRPLPQNAAMVAILACAMRVL